MLKLFSKIISLLLIIGLNWFGLSAIGQTWAYFNDTEISFGNVFAAGTLDFSLTNTDIEEFIGIELGEDIEFISVATKMTGSMDIQYQAYAEKMSGNDDFCSALQIEVFHSQISYDGDLLSFNTATTTNLGAWAFEIKLPSAATHIPHGEECNVDLVFKGWREDVADFDNSGFTDEEQIHLRLTSRMIVLNEFLPNPEGVAYGFDFGDNSSDMPQGEWVELYNNSDFSFDLAGWYIKDELETDTNKIMITALNTAPATTVIGAKSWLVVYMNKAVLNNDGDTVRLFDNTDTLIDAYTYTGTSDYCDIEPTPGDENTTDTAGSCAGVPPNKSYARIPDGIGYWVDPIPTPGAPNLLESDTSDINSISSDSLIPAGVNTEQEDDVVELTPEEEPAESIEEGIVGELEEEMTEMEPADESTCQETEGESDQVDEEMIEEKIEEVQDDVDDVFEEVVEAIEEIVEEIIEPIEEVMGLEEITEELPEESVLEEPIEEIIEPELVEELTEEPAEEPVEPELVDEPVEEEIVETEELLVQEEAVTENVEMIIEEEPEDISLEKNE